MQKSKRLERLISEMEMHGYIFDELESHRKWLHFFGEYGPISFPNIRALAEWLRGVVFD